MQIADTFEDQMNVLSRTVDISKATEEDMKRIKKRCECIQYWLKAFAPDQVKFSISQTIPAGVELKMNDKAFLQSLVARMNDCNWDPETISNIISECGKASPIGLKNAYKVIYNLIIGKSAGPRLGTFLASMDKQFVINRFNQAAYN